MPIDSGYFWTIVLLLGAGTFGFRASLIFLSGRIQVTERLREIFSLIPAAILPALITPMVFFHQGQTQWLFEKERFVVLLFATIIAFLFRNMFVTILFGLVLLYVVTHSLPVG